MSEITMLEKMNKVVNNPVSRIKMLKKLAQDIRVLSIWPQTFLEQAITAEEAEGKAVPDDIRERIRNAMGEDDYSTSIKHQEQCLQLITSFLERVKPELDKICLEVGFDDPTAAWSMVGSLFVEWDKKEGWR